MVARDLLATQRAVEGILTIEQACFYCGKRDFDLCDAGMRGSQQGKPEFQGTFVRLCCAR